MTLPRSRRRSQVVIPAQGMIEVRDALTDLLNEHGTDDMDGTYMQLAGLSTLFPLLVLFFSLSSETRPCQHRAHPVASTAIMMNTCMCTCSVLFTVAPSCHSLFLRLVFVILGYSNHPSFSAAFSDRHPCSGYDRIPRRSDRSP